MAEDPYAHLPYRANVGAALFNADGRVLIARRADIPGPLDAPGTWQMPQGGLDKGEEPRDAVLRELREEIGTDRAEIIGEHADWLTYDLPPEVLGHGRWGKYRGQKQRWFALRFTGTDADIRLDLDPHPEFIAWRWERLEAVPALTVAFRRPIYEVVARDFAGFARKG
ncbi:MAG TPA: RNA pyrophosphohydrolase [Acetobacteraceae bacterium]|nr:RNA pyrophosphohydrolase [Acetobacteraceae bacterium]